MDRSDESTHLMFAAPAGPNPRGIAASHALANGWTAGAASAGMLHMHGLKAAFSTRTVLAAALFTFGAIGALAPVAKAQISVNIGIQPVCSYGYYDYSPYACAPMGFYGTGYFYNGIFLGMGPWAGWGYGHGWGEHRFVSDGGGRYHGGGGAAAGRAYASGHTEGGGASGHEAGASHAEAAHAKESHPAERPAAAHAPAAHTSAPHASARPAAEHSSAPHPSARPAAEHASAPHATAKPAAAHSGGGGAAHPGGAAHVAEHEEHK
jgi:hypothetical protein